MGRITLLVAPLCALIVLLASSTGCGGGGGGGAATDGGSTGGNLTTAQRLAAIEAVERKFEELQATATSPENLNKSLADFMRSHPSYGSAGIDAPSSTVYGQFVDGRLHMVVNNRYPGQGAAPAYSPPRRRLAPADLPGSKQVRLFHTFGPGFDSQASVNNVAGWMQDSGYTVVPGAEGEGHVPTLRRISGDAFFYMNTHGGGARLEGTSSFIYAVQSSTLLSPEGEELPEYVEDLKAWRLAYMTTPNGEATTIFGRTIYKSDTRYAVTGAFVEKYWSFGPRSIVFLNACNSADSRASGFVFACHKKGAAVVLGWTKSVSSGSAYHSIQYFADRLLGSNSFEEEDPPQRPFDWKSVMQDMASEGHDTDASSGAKLVAFPARACQSRRSSTPASSSCTSTSGPTSFSSKAVSAPLPARQPSMAPRSP